jgi:hypothetical protein
VHLIAFRSVSHSFFLLTWLYALDRSMVAVYRGKYCVDSSCVFLRAILGLLDNLGVQLVCNWRWLLFHISWTSVWQSCFGGVSVWSILIFFFFFFSRFDEVAKVLTPLIFSTRFKSRWCLIILLFLLFLYVEGWILKPLELSPTQPCVVTTQPESRIIPSEIFYEVVIPVYQGLHKSENVTIRFRSSRFLNH